MLLGILLIVVNVSDTQQTWNQRVAPSWIGLDAKSLAAAFLTTSAPPIQRHRSVLSDGMTTMRTHARPIGKGHVNLPLRVDSVLVHGRSWSMKSRSNQCCRSQFRRPPSFFVSDEVLPKQPPKALNVIVLCRHLFSS